MLTLYFSARTRVAHIYISRATDRVRFLEITHPFIPVIAQLNFLERRTHIFLWEKYMENFRDSRAKYFLNVAHFRLVAQNLRLFFYYNGIILMSIHIIIGTYCSVCKTNKHSYDYFLNFL